MGKILPANYFNRPTEEVAKALLGKVLARKYKGRIIKAIITEVEVYDGLRDKGSHAYKGITKRNLHMFGAPGVWYVYFTYGVHWMLNIVTRENGYPAAILIRGMEGAKGPGRLTKFMGIDGKLNGLPATKSCGLWIEDAGLEVPASKIKKGPRIGINYAGPFWSKRNLRFWIGD